MTDNRQLAAIALVALVVGSTVGFAFAGGFDSLATADDPGSATAFDDPTIDRFDSREQFAAYLRDSRSSSGMATFQTRDVAIETDDAAVEEEMDREDQATTAADGDAAASDSGGGADRHAETNVQEAALDEPDVLKTDGETVYYADRRHRGTLGSTAVVDASEPADPSVTGEINTGGELLLADDTLVVFKRSAIYGYDVTDRSDPERTWTTALDGHVEAARLYDGDVYLVVADHVSPDDPCPIEPAGDDGPEVACTDVHYPTEQNDANTVYTTMRVDPENGEVEDAVSFLGSSRTTATYVSENAVYLTYADAPSRADLRLEFLLSDGRAHLDDEAIDRLEQLRSYDLSEAATRAEIRAILDDWRAGLERSERRTAERDLEEAWKSYATENLRQFSRTGVVEVGIDGDLAVDAAGAVPGTPLNQWSMDEHDGHLRVATTVRAPGVDAENDLYVLDDDLETVGSVTGMGVDERIYSVRYVGETAYVVTFRQIDPFHVIDVSDPENPQLEGELKLPGFSTYMHPLGDDRVLGIGEEGGKVKAVIFDASDPSNPVVEDDVILEDRWSAVQESHTAFLIDERHGVFFLPGSEGGHVFAYEDGLERVTTVETNGPAMRATYLDDYLYVFGEDELVVVDETTWEEETYLDL